MLRRANGRLGFACGLAVSLPPLQGGTEGGRPQRLIVKCTAKDKRQTPRYLRARFFSDR